jgi:hypothetical protein
MKVQLGDFGIHSVPEVEFAVSPCSLFRDATDEKVAAQRD